jgi:hypothetical protein
LEMTKISRFLIVGLCLLVFSAGCHALEIFPLAHVVPGLVGVGKTVIQGREIEEFSVEVLGIVPQSRPLPDLIMVRLSGPAIEKAGGLASGMSGSPVYIDGALLGAVSHGYSGADKTIGLVTPAQAMFDVLNRIAPLEVEAAQPEPVEDMVALAAPVVVTGIGGRALDYLSRSLDPLRLSVMPGLAHQGEHEPVSLEPGSAFAVQLLKGDFQAAVMGTVTHVTEDGRFVGMGHSVTHRGSVGFFAADAYVHYTMPSLDVPYKIFSVGEVVGGVFEDRAAGVAGTFGQLPDYLPVTITVRDSDQGTKQEYKVDVVSIPSLMIPLVLASAYQGVDAGLDRIGPGTSYVRLQFDSPQIPQPMIRENLYYSDSDIAVWSLTDLMDGLELLANNSLQDVELTHISVEVEVGQARRTASIEQAVPRLSTVTPGDSLEIEVTIRPYRQEPEKRILRIEIPEDTMPGLLTVTVRSGAAGYYVTKPPVHVPLTPATELGDEEEVPHTVATGAESLEKLITDFMEREKNNEIVAEFYPFIDSFATSSKDEAVEGEAMEDSAGEIEDRAMPAFRWNDGSSDVQKVRLTTQYVIEGLATFDVEVVAPEY